MSTTDWTKRGSGSSARLSAISPSPATSTTTASPGRRARGSSAAVANNRGPRRMASTCPVAIAGSVSVRSLSSVTLLGDPDRTVDQPERAATDHPARSFCGSPRALAPLVQRYVTMLVPPAELLAAAHA